ncbi:asparagine synthase-related protein [Frankia sp. R82]|uniref:asparagine synthase-related protein n=1 Tax=Frankia sp. R82 TaxID=2950553 RepID=UPI0020449781|nr:asparagine synthase-related protein [Frankia sp. R82]MCM3883615.1 asparagine synthase-related protein [Frankia sp. R82]
MTTSTLRHRPACWFVVLPDREQVAVPAGGRQVVRHRSGRPWIVGDWPAAAMVSATAGRRQIALVGCAAVRPGRLLGLLVAAHDVHTLDLGREVAGDYHLIAEIDGQARIQGTATGTRRIFTARVGGHLLAADRADILAGLCGARLDRTALALALLDPSPPHPLDDLVPFTSVTAVPPEDYLFVDRDEQSRTIRRWRAPAAVRSRSEGAAVLRAALAEAVAVRVAGGRTVSADLSGGLDSSAVCCLAARGPADVVALTGLARDPGDDDAYWAGRLAASLPSLTRETLAAADLPLVYDRIDEPGPTTDRPFVGVVDRAKLLAGLDHLALYAPRLHLTGFGGDELVGGAPNHLPSLIRRRPVMALRHLRGYRAQEGWPWAASLRMMRSRDYRDCLRDMARVLAVARDARTGGTRATRGVRVGYPGRPGRSARMLRTVGRRTRPYVTALDWTPPPVVPGWLTDDALDLVAEAFAVAAEQALPLAETRAGHTDLFTLRAGAAAFRGFDQIADPLGPPLSAPFYDERVVRAALAVRPELRASPWEYKPLLKEAMQSVVPAECLGRRTKADASTEEDQGLRANREMLVKLCDASPLAELGLIEPDLLRQACRTGAVPDHRAEALQPTIATDAWLRALTGTVLTSPVLTRGELTTSELTTSDRGEL